MARTKPPAGQDRTPAKVRHPVHRAAQVQFKVAAPASPIKKTLWFHSKGKLGYLAYLSNFQTLPEGQCIPRGTCLVPARGGNPEVTLSMDVFSVEQGLVDAKVSLAAGPAAGKAAVRQLLAAAPTPPEVRLIGKRASFTRHGLVLDVELYDELFVGILGALLRARARADAQFADTIRGVSTPRNGVVYVLRHFARSLHYRVGENGVFTANSVAGRNAEALGPLMQTVVADMDREVEARTAPHPAFD